MQSELKAVYMICSEGKVVRAMRSIIWRMHTLHGS